MMESMYSLAHSADAELQRQLSREQEVPAGTPLSEALASKGLSSGTRTSSISSASGGDANTSFTSDSPSVLSPHHEPATDIHNLYSPVPKKTDRGLAKPVPKPRSATLNPHTRNTDSLDPSEFTSSLQLPGQLAIGGTLPLAAAGGRAELLDDGYLRPRPANRANYDQLPPGPPRPAIQQVANSRSPKQHRSALLKDRSAQQEQVSSDHAHITSPPVASTYINVKHNMSEEVPPPISRNNKPSEPSPPRVDRKLKPNGSDAGSESPPVFPTRTSSLANTLEPADGQSHDTHLTRNIELLPGFPTRTTSLVGLEASASFREGDKFSETDVPKPSTHTMQYSQIEFNRDTGNPAIKEHGDTPPQPKERKGSLSDDVRRHPIPAPRRVNYSDIDLTATNALSKGIPKRQVTLREAERESLNDKPYINVSRQGEVDEDSDPGYYMHMRVSGWDLRCIQCGFVLCQL